MSTIQVNADIRKARTLDSDFYTNERNFELSKERIFARTWHFLGRESEVSGLAPVTILPDFLDEPALVARNGDSIVCLSNVCTHRGKVLVEAPCEAKLIRCGYHGRRFSLDGKFLSMPEFDGVEDFPSESDNLPHLACVRRGGFIFASIDPADNFDAFVPAGSPFDEIDPAALEFKGRRDYEVNAHWALYCENYLEGFHIPYVHRSLNSIVDYGTYTTETFRYSSLQTAFDSDGRPNDRVVATPGFDLRVAARYLFVFPNLMFNFYAWGVSVNVVRPVSASRSVVEFLTYVSDESLIETGAGADLEGVEMEDEAVVESVQRGIRSRFYKSGRYSPTREQGTHHFHRLIAEFMVENR